MQGGKDLAPDRIELTADLPDKGGELSVSVSFDAHGAVVEASWPLGNERVASVIPTGWEVSSRRRHMLASGRLEASDAWACVEEVRKIFSHLVELPTVTYWFAVGKDAISIRDVPGDGSHRIVLARFDPPLAPPEDAEHGGVTLALLTALHEADFTTNLATFDDGEITVTLAEASPSDPLAHIRQLVALYRESHHTT